MIEKSISKHILTVGLAYNTPRGGIAQVLNTYSKMYEPFNFVMSSKSDSNSIERIFIALKCYFKLILILFKNKDIKIIHIHSASGKSFYRQSVTIILSRLLKKYIVFHSHGGGFIEFRENNKGFVDYIIRKCNCIVCLSESWKNYFENTYKEMKVCIVNNVIDYPHSSLLNKDGKFHVLFLGKICDAKGVFVLISSFVKYKNKLDDKVVLHIAGSGEVERLNKIINDNKLNNIVAYEGWADATKKNVLLNICDVYVLPSYVEGVPISILEAESYKKPVITTNVGGISSIVKDGENGLFVNVGNVDDIYNAIIRLMSDAFLYNQMSEKCYDVSRKHFPDYVEKQLIQLYTEVL